MKCPILARIMDSPNHHEHPLSQLENTMTNRTSIITLFLLLSCATCFAQTAYNGVTPGKSTRADAERVFAKPVKNVSETLVEYSPQPRTSKVYVQYRKDSQVTERIEMAGGQERF